MTTTINANVERDYPDFLRDESRLTGRADSISFPQSEQDIRETIALMASRNTPVTIQGARTGITGGATPVGGHVINLSRMNLITGLRRAGGSKGGDRFFVTVQPGVVLSQLTQAIVSKEFNTDGWSQESLNALADFGETGPWFFPPDPTETTAAIGGMIASNASGACSFLYGPTRNYVERIRVVLADGSLLALERGAKTTSGQATSGQAASGRALRSPSADRRSTGQAFSLTTENGRTIRGALPSYRMPSVKNAAGYYAAENMDGAWRAMDLMDLFIGSEGTLGVFSEIELRLIPAPKTKWGVTAFFPSEEDALCFVQALRELPAGPAAIEFFDSRALDLLRKQKKNNPAFADIPDMPPEYHTAVYVEYHGESEDSVGEAVMEMSGTMQEYGGDEDATWIADNNREMERLRTFRHAVPEAVNLLIDERRKKEPGLTKLGTDMAVPDACLRDVIDLYHRRLQNTGLEYVMFGHIGDNHIHVNILPNSMEEYDAGKRLYLEWAREIVSMGGTVSAEHGIGKLKVAFLEAMYGKAGIEQMRELKKAFDPKGILNRGNLFEWGKGQVS